MNRRSVLNKQAVKRKISDQPSMVWSGIRLTCSVAFKISLLAAGLAAISLIFLSLYQYLVTSPYTRLEEVVITGVDEGEKKELVEFSQLTPGISLLALNLNDLKTKLEKHPWIKSVELEKQFPHTLIIRSEKEIPRALVAFDSLYYMNSSGIIFKEVQENEDTDFPVITGISSPDNIEQLKLATRILDLFVSEKGYWSPNELSEVHVNGNSEAYVYSVSIPAVLKLGDYDLDKKKIELEKIVSHLKRTGRIHLVKGIDLNYSDGAVVSFSNG
jgi:cell division protein FtsQ